MFMAITETDRVNEQRSERVGFGNTREFYQRSIELGVDQRILEGIKSEPVRNAFLRSIEVTETYLQTDLTIEEIGSARGITHQRVSQLIKRGLEALAEAAPPELRDAFLQDSLESRKPQSLRSRQAQSIARGGVALEVLELSKQGKDVATITAAVGITGRNLSQVRRTLKKWGTEELLYTKKGAEHNNTIRATLSNPNSTDEQIAEAMGKTSQALYFRDAKKGHRLFTSVSSIARQCGFHFRPEKIKQFVRVLEEAGIPIRKLCYEIPNGRQKGTTQTYYIFATIQKERIKEVLNKAVQLQSFKQNPVWQVCGAPIDQLPNTTQIRKGDGICTVGFALKKAGFDVFKTSKPLIGPNCPVPIFRTRAGFFLRTGDLEQFISYVQKASST